MRGKTTSLEIVDAKPLEGRRKTFSDKEIAEGFIRADEAKKNFQIECVRTGLMLQVKKAELKHGQFKPYIEKLQNGRTLPFSGGQKGNTLPFSKIQNSTNLDISINYETAKLYMYLAKGFSKWSNEKSATFSFTNRGVFALLSDSSAERKKAFEIATDFVGGRSLRRMLKDFRQAEKAAAEEGKPKKKPDKRSPDQIRADAREAICEEIAGHINSLQDTLKRPYLQYLKVEDFEEFGDHIKWVGNEFLKLVARDKRK